MDKNKKEIGSLTAEAGKNAAAFWNKAKKTLVNAADQNNDGAFDLKDISAIAESIGNAAKSTANSVLSSAEEKGRELERKQLQPIFIEDLDNADFLLSKLIRVTDIDKRHAESEICTGSIGFISDQKDLRIINIYKDKVDAFGLTFFPDTDCDFYYVDPSDRDKYIALDDYFSYLKIARVNELQKIAQDLGAKYFRVTYKEKKTQFSKNHIDTKGTAKFLGNSFTADYDHDLSSSSVSAVEVAAEMHCPGHAPIQPVLNYLQRESSIHTLISLRMDKASPITHHKYTLSLSNSSGIKAKDAIKIDAALKSLKAVGNTTVSNEVQNESRRFFEYEIDF